MSELGIIGQIYEDRRTKKQGKLIDRDEKFKTLLMESSDGKSFNISFGGFKSNWRKVDEPVQTIEEAMEEAKIPNEVADVISTDLAPKPRKKYKKKPKPESGICIALEDAIKSMVEYLDSFNSNKLSLDPKFDRELVTVKVGRCKLMEVFHKPTTKYFTIACKDDIAKVANKQIYINGVNYYETRKPLNYAFRVSDDNFNKFLNDLRPLIVDILSERVEEDK